MPYDKALDECVVAKSWENDQEKLTASIFSYNKGIKNCNLPGRIKTVSSRMIYQDSVVALYILQFSSEGSRADRCPSVRLSRKGRWELERVNQTCHITKSPENCPVGGFEIRPWLDAIVNQHMLQ